MFNFLYRKNKQKESIESQNLVNKFPSKNGFLDGQTALITGGAGMIGCAITQELIQQGALVKVIDKNLASLEQLQKKIDHPLLQIYQADLTNTEEMDKLDLPETIDILVHVAGIQHEKQSIDETDRDWETILQTNVVAPARLTRQLMPRFMKQQKGSIMMITSIHATLPSRWTSYSATKSAQSALIREWAVDLAPYGVRVNGIAPGWVDNDVKKSKLALLHNQTIPPQYIARAVTYLASDYFSLFTTGTIMVLDAGMSLYSGRVPFDLPKKENH